MKRPSLKLIIALLLLHLVVGIACAIKRHAAKDTDCVPVYTSGNSSGDHDRDATLMRFKEIPLRSFPGCVDEAYRLVWNPSFHSPVTVRIWRTSDKYFLVSKELDGKGGYGMGNLATESTHPITKDQWLTFVRLLDQASFWDMPTADDAPQPNDGAAWLVEGLKNKKSHEVYRRTPSEDFRASCVYLVKISGLKTEIEKY